MRVPYHQNRMLRRMDRRLCRSDRHLATMLAIFTRLYASEPIVSAEQVRRAGVLAALIWLGSTATRLAGWLAVGACRAIRRVVVAFPGRHGGNEEISRSTT
jgi:hypothetical protein